MRGQEVQIVLPIFFKSVMKFMYTEVPRSANSYTAKAHLIILYYVSRTIAFLMTRLPFRYLHSAAKNVDRAHNVGFIGLGQMGYAMATNWVKKRVTGDVYNPTNSGFTIYDIDSARIALFAKSLNEVYPGANVSVASNPAE